MNQTHPQVPGPVVPSAAPLPAGLLGWMSFVGVMTILGGAINILTCIGIIQGVLMVIAGAAVVGAKSSLMGIQAVHPALSPFFEKLKQYFVFTGIVYVLIIVVVGLLFLFYFGVIMAIIAGAEGGF
jgi:hypothetical protein